MNSSKLKWLTEVEVELSCCCEMISKQRSDRFKICLIERRHDQPAGRPPCFVLIRSLERSSLEVENMSRLDVLQ